MSLMYCRIGPGSVAGGWIEVVASAMLPAFLIRSLRSTNISSYGSPRALIFRRYSTRPRMRSASYMSLKVSFIRLLLSSNRSRASAAWCHSSYDVAASIAFLNDFILARGCFAQFLSLRAARPDRHRTMSP